jgi:triosephosphate isomerase (TIM)
MLKDLGIHWTLVGHSERRALFNETDAVVAKKTARALETGVGVIGCLGETLAEFDAGHTEQVVARQLKAYADVLKDWSHFVM